VSCSLVAWGEAGHAAAAKSQLAKQTAPFRGRVRARALARNLLEVRRMALPRARAVWSDETLDASERRRRIFMLWDECVESGDESVLATARFVRAAIAGFVDHRLPEGHPDGFTAVQLDRRTRFGHRRGGSSPMRRLRVPRRRLLAELAPFSEPLRPRECAALVSQELELFVAIDHPTGALPVVHHEKNVPSETERGPSHRRRDEAVRWRACRVRRAR